MAAVGGDTEIPAAASALDRETFCFICALVSAAVVIAAGVAASLLPVSQRGLTVWRIICILTAGALALGVLGLAAIA